MILRSVKMHENLHFNKWKRNLFEMWNKHRWIAIWVMRISGVFFHFIDMHTWRVYNKLSLKSCQLSSASLLQFYLLFLTAQIFSLGRLESHLSSSRKIFTIHVNNQFILVTNRNKFLRLKLNFKNHCFHRIYDEI